MLTKHTMNQRLERLQSENQDTESARELSELKRQFNISVEERLAELQRAEEAECPSMVNSHRIKDMSQEIVEMRDAAGKLMSDATRKKEEAEKIKEESDTARETYATMKQDLDELAEICAENEGLQEEIRLSREVKEVKSAMQENCDEESSHRSLVGSLTVELDGIQRENLELKGKESSREEVEEGEWAEATRKVDEIMCEAERRRKDAEEMRKQADQLRREAATTHTKMGEAVKQLEVVGKAVEKAEVAEKRAVKDMRVLTDKKESLTQDEPDKKIRISMKEYEDLRGKHEESERMVEFKAKTVAAQLEEIKESRIQGERMLEEKMKEMEELI